MSKKTTETDFTMFKDECARWIKFFGLYNWRVHYIHQNSPDCTAYIYYPSEIEDRTVTIGLCVDVDEDAEILRCAFHEVIHLLLYRLTYAAGCRFVQPEEISDAEHELIRIMENTIFNKC